MGNYLRRSGGALSVARLIITFPEVLFCINQRNFDLKNCQHFNKSILSSYYKSMRYHNMTMMKKAVPVWFPDVIFDWGGGDWAPRKRSKITSGQKP